MYQFRITKLKTMLVFFVLPQDLSIVASSLAAAVVAVVEFVYYFDSITIIGDLYDSPIGKNFLITAARRTGKMYFLFLSFIEDNFCLLVLFFVQVFYSFNFKTIIVIICLENLVSFSFKGEILNISCFFYSTSWCYKSFNRTG